MVKQHRQNVWYQGFAFVDQWAEGTCPWCILANEWASAVYSSTDVACINLWSCFLVSYNLMKDRLQGMRLNIYSFPTQNAHTCNTTPTNANKYLPYASKGLASPFFHVLWFELTRKEEGGERIAWEGGGIRHVVGLFSCWLIHAFLRSSTCSFEMSRLSRWRHFQSNLSLKESHKIGIINSRLEPWDMLPTGMTQHYPPLWSCSFLPCQRHVKLILPPHTHLCAPVFPPWAAQRFHSGISVRPNAQRPSITGCIKAGGAWFASLARPAG